MLNFKGQISFPLIWELNHEDPRTVKVENYNEVRVNA